MYTLHAYPTLHAYLARYIVALAFSGDGKRLVAVTGDNRHTVCVFFWRSKKLLYQDVGYNGQPPQVGRRVSYAWGGGVGGEGGGSDMSLCWGGCGAWSEQGGREPGGRRGEGRSKLRHSGGGPQNIAT